MSDRTIYYNGMSERERFIYEYEEGLEAERTELLWSLMTRPLSDNEMSAVKERGISILCKANSSCGKEHDLRMQFNDLVHKQALLQMFAKLHDRSEVNGCRSEALRAAL